VLAAEVDRLLALPAVKANIAAKVGSWLSVRKTEVTVKDPKVFPEFTPSVMSSLTQSLQLFLRDVVERGSLLELVTSRKLYLNQELAGLTELQVSAARRSCRSRPPTRNGPAAS